MDRSSHRRHAGNRHWIIHAGDMYWSGSLSRNSCKRSRYRCAYRRYKPICYKPLSKNKRNKGGGKPNSVTTEWGWYFELQGTWEAFQTRYQEDEPPESSISEVLYFQVVVLARPVHEGYYWAQSVEAPVTADYSLEDQE